MGSYRVRRHRAEIVRGKAVRLQQWPLHGYSNHNHDKREQNNSNITHLPAGVDLQFRIDGGSQVTVENKDGKVAEADKEKIGMDLQKKKIAGHCPCRSKE